MTSIDPRCIQDQTKGNSATVLEFFSGLHVHSEVGTQIKCVGYRQLSFLGKQKEKTKAFSSIPVKRRKKEALES